MCMSVTHISQSQRWERELHRGIPKEMRVVEEYPHLGKRKTDENITFRDGGRETRKACGITEPESAKEDEDDEPRS